MAKLRTDRVPASVGGHVWNTIDDIVEVEADLAHDLLRIPDAHFHEIQPEPVPEVVETSKAKAKTATVDPAAPVDSSAK